MDDLKLLSKSERGLESLVNTVCAFSSDIGMEFRVNKCAKLAMQRGKITQSQGVNMPNREQIKATEEGKGYKDLGITEADQVLCKEMKASLTKEYFRRVRKLLRSKLTRGNLIIGINPWVISLLKYSASFIEWTKNELRLLDQRTRKLLNVWGEFNLMTEARLYLPRKMGGRRLIAVEDCVKQNWDLQSMLQKETKD